MHKNLRLTLGALAITVAAGVMGVLWSSGARVDDASRWSWSAPALEDVRRRMARDLATLMGEAHASGPGSSTHKAIEEFALKVADLEQLAKKHGFARVVVRYKDQPPPVTEPGMASRANYWFWKQVGMPAAAPPKRLGLSRQVRKDVTESELKRLAEDPKVELLVPDVPIPPALATSGSMVRPGIARVMAAASRPARQQFAAVVLDSGVEADHPFLENTVLTAFEACFSSEHLPEPYRAESLCPDASAAMTGPGAGKPCAGMQGCDHGTHVAGILAGWPSTHAGQRLSGVAPGVPIIPVQIYSRFKSDTFCGSIGRSAPCIAAFISDQLAALDHVKELNDKGVAIGSVNMSLAIRSEKGQCNTLDLAAGITERIRELKRLNIATVIAAGNDGTLDRVSVPGCIEDAITVAASDRSAQLAVRYPDAGGGSNYSELVDLAAPGVTIMSAVPGKAFQQKSGTSMAAPHVAGLLALVRQSKPAATVDEQLRILTVAATRFVEHPVSGLKRPMALLAEDAAINVAVPAAADPRSAPVTRSGVSASSVGSVRSGTRLILDFGDEDPVAAERRIRDLLTARGIPIIDMQSKTSRLGVVVTDKPVDPAILDAVREAAQIKGLYLDTPQVPPR